MVNLETVEQEILDLERKDTSYAVVERLAWLYIVRDHLQTTKADARTGSINGNEFCMACSDVPIDQLISILSEHMDVIKVTYPKEYDAIIKRIKSL